MSPGMIASLLIALSTTSLAQNADGNPSAARIDRVVSVVGSSVITLSDIELERAFQRFDPIKCPPLEAPQVEILKVVEERRILQKLAAGRALYTPKANDIQSRLETFKKRTGDQYPKFLKQWGITEDQLREVFKQRMVEEAYVERNLGRSLLTEIPENDANRSHHYRQRYQPWIEARKQGLSIRRIPDSAP